MGVVPSSLKDFRGKRSPSISDEEEMDDFNFSIPYDLIVDVLSYVPAADLIKNCRLVCKLWKEIIDGHFIWKIKCNRENKCIPPVKFENIPSHYYRLIYLHNPYGANLISNPCAENAMENWILVQNRGDGFAVESPPGGADPIPSEVGSSSCFVTSYYLCQKYQLIDLVGRGIHPEILDLPNTKIEIGEWYAARFDCASIYELNVILLSGEFKKTGTINPSECTIDKFDFKFSEEQWVGREWHKVSHTFDAIKGTRYVLFQHSGKDSQFWAGHYGTKMTGAYVKVLV